MSFNVNAMQKLVDVASGSFLEIGLQLNALKTKWLAVCRQQTADNLLLCGQPIAQAEAHTLVRYLGAHFDPQQAFDAGAAIKEFGNKLQLVIATELLYQNQKLQLLQQYLLPILNYTFQITPTALVRNNCLEELDFLVTNGMRQLLQLPAGSPNAFYYAPRTMRGLAITRFVWEARLQRITALASLHGKSMLFTRQQAWIEEAMLCLGRVQIERSVSTDFFKEPNLSSKLRQELRKRSFDEWAAMGIAGKGVQLFSLVSASNRWLSHKNPMSLTDWLMSIKMSVNQCDLLSHPRSQQENKSCRRCSRHFESIGHVLQFCDANHGLINDRHNAVVNIIADELKKLRFTVDVEVRCTGVEHVEVAEVDVGDQDLAPSRDINVSRRIDIVAVNEARTQAFLIDPTIRIESTESSVQDALQQKKRTYEPTVEYFRRHLGMHNVEVAGIWFGSRGTHHPTTVNFFKRLGLLKGRSTVLLDNITKIILSHSSLIMRNHLWAKPA